MATKVRVEWVSVSLETRSDNRAQNILESWFGTPVALTAFGTATVAGSRPTVPSDTRIDAPGVNGASSLYARVSAVDGNVIVEKGANPTASQSNGVLVLSGTSELIPVIGGDRLSLIELA